MTAPFTTPRLIIADASKVSGIDFYRSVFGKPPLTEEDKAQREAERQAWIAERRAESRRELEELRDRLCAQASPELAAQFRAKWALEDAGDAMLRKDAA